jgi:hypothetical protein
MNKLLKLALFLIIFFALERFTRSQTDGFRLEKTLADVPFEVQGEEPMPTDRLNQTFTFLGSGVQSYAFLGEDNETVLKLFKHYHFGLPSRVLKHLTFLPKVSSWITRRGQRMGAIFESAHLAQKHLRAQTGLLSAHLVPAADAPVVTLIDRIGIHHTLDLSKAPFVLQKRAIPLANYLKHHPDEADTLARSQELCVANREACGIINTDKHTLQNMGVLDGQVIEIDIGSFCTK